MKISCTICRELFLSTHVVLVTNCGHLYHKNCISQWAEKQHSCPQCRAKLVFQPIRVYFNIEDDLDNSCREELEAKYAELNEKYAELSIQQKVMTEKVAAANEETELLNKKIKKLKEENTREKYTAGSLKEELSRAMAINKEVGKVKRDYEKVTQELALLKSVELMLKGSEQSVKDSLENMPCTPQSLRQLLTYIEVLKQQSTKNSDRYKKMFQSQKPVLDELASLKRANESLKSQIDEYQYQLQNSNTKSPPASSQLNKAIYSVDLCSPVISDVAIKVIDKHQIRKQSTDLMKSSKLAPSKRFLSAATASSSSAPGFSFDGMGGSKRISLAKPTPAEDLLRLRAKKHLVVKNKNVRPIERMTISTATVPEIMDVSMPECEFIELD